MSAPNKVHYHVGSGERGKGGGGGGRAGSGIGRGRGNNVSFGNDSAQPSTIHCGGGGGGSGYGQNTAKMSSGKDYWSGKEKDQDFWKHFRQDSNTVIGTDVAVPASSSGADCAGRLLSQSFGRCFKRFLMVL